MIAKKLLVLFVATTVLFSIFAVPTSAATPPSAAANPDLTKGEKIPEGASHDWTLGPTGARGWMFSDKLVTADARQIAITEVEKNSPADGILAIGDVILGVGGKPFSYDPRTELGKSITGAETEVGGGKLSLIRWRAGEMEDVVLKLTVLGTYNRKTTVPQLDAPTTRSLILGGRGWSNKDRNSFYDELTEEQLLERLASWSPVVRERAAMALARRQEAPIAALAKMLESSRVESRYGACQALAKFKGNAAPAVPELRKTLRHEDLWLRVKAAQALASIGEPAMSAVPELLQMLAKGPSEDDPRGMEQRYLCFALFNQRDGMLGRSLESVERESLYAAVGAGLRNEDGRARGSIGSVYRNLTYQEIEPLLPVLHRAVIEPAPSGIMFADGIRLEGLRLLGKHRVKEGIDGCVKYTRTQNPWASEKRTPELMKILLGYGAHAKSTIPELRQIADYFENDEQDFPRRLGIEKAKVVRETIRAIETSNDYPELIRIE